MNKNKINVLFICVYGVGSSALSEMIVSKALKEANINAEVQHTAFGEMEGLLEWADVIAISKKLLEESPIDVTKHHVVEVVNIMDGKGIAKQISAVVDEFYPDAYMK